MKKAIFIILLLALASLGSALPSYLPPKTPGKSPKIPPPGIPTPGIPPKTPPKTPITPVTPAVASPLVGLDAATVESELQVSKECAAALLQIATSPDFLKCIPVNAFLPLLPIVTDPNFFKDLAADPAGTFKKDEAAFVQFSTAFCPTQKCSDQAVAGAVKLLSDGCKEDLKNNPVIQTIFAVAVFYSPLHDTVCFKSTDHKNLFCWDESLETVFGLPKSPIKVTGNPLLDSIAVADCKAVCTDCNKSVVNTFFNFIKGNDLALQILNGLGVTQKVLDSLTLGVAVKCGINFEDGQVPNKS